jgi:hypothetical protein
MPDELSEENRMDNARTTTLRVRDETIRNLVGELKQQTMALLLARSQEATMSPFASISCIFDKLNTRIGELLRVMDDEEG